MRPSALAVFLVTLLTSGLAHATTTVSKGPWIQRVTHESAIVRLETSTPTPVRLQVAGNKEYASEKQTLHSFVLTGLTPATRYPFTVLLDQQADPAAGEVITAPAQDSTDTFRFLAYGDNRTDDAAHAAVVKAMSRVPSDFLVHTGDFVGRGENAQHWETFFKIEQPLISKRCMFSAVGNHEITDGSGILYARFFGPTDVAPTALKPDSLNGTFRWGNTRLFLINGMVPWQGTPDRAWLDKVLTDADSEPGLRWRIAVTHHGPWSSGPHGNNARLHDAGIPALLKAHGVDVIFSGHDHIYERGFGNIAYMVTGGGGAPVYKIKNTLPEAKKVESVHHFVEVVVTPAALLVNSIRSDSSTIEKCGLPKGAFAWDCDGVTVVADGGVLPAPSSVAATAPTTNTKSRCTCDAVGAAPPNSLGALVFGLLVYCAHASRRALRAPRPRRRLHHLQGPTRSKPSSVRCERS